MTAATADPLPEFDQSRAANFVDRIGHTLNEGAVSLMVSVGHRAGLFEALASLPPSTSERIAATANLAERYVREWLAATVTGGIVEYDPATRTYFLPPEHAACLTRDGAFGNLAVYGQYIALMGAFQERILDCFRTGEGTQYSEYPCFHQIMAEDSAQTVAAQLFDLLLPLIPGITSRLENGIDVLDAGCGRGLALIALAKRFPDSRFVGLDLCPDAIAFGQQQARTENLGNLHFEARDLSGYNERERYDLITSFDAVHDQKDPQGLIDSLYRALRPGGHYLLQDIGGSAHLENNMDFPMATLLYAISCFHCTPVSLGQGGAGLGTMWGWETARTMLEAAGFSNIDRHVLPHDPMNVWFVAERI